MQEVSSCFIVVFFWVDWVFFCRDYCSLCPLKLVDLNPSDFVLFTSLLDAVLNCFKCLLGEHGSQMQCQVLPGEVQKEEMWRVSSFGHVLCYNEGA